MEFALSDEQTELAATVRSLLLKRGDSRVERFDEGLWRLVTDQVGVASLNIPEEFGGAGFSLFESLVALEEFGRALVPSPLLSSLIVSEALLAGSDQTAQNRLLPLVASGTVAAFVDCSDGVEASNVLDGDLATIFVVATDDGLFEVGVDSIRREWVPSMDQTLRLARVQVNLDGATRISVDSENARARALLVGSVGCAVLASGATARALEMTVSYSKERIQFGRAIGSFQALKHRMADMLVLQEMSRSAAWAAGYSLSVGSTDAAELVHVAKSYCCEALSLVASEMIQLHGGIAITWEHDAHLVFKRSHALEQLFGAPHEHRRQLNL